jgi:hypothetical protein
MRECPPGAYCPEASISASNLCPPGTYSSSVRLSSLDNCTVCPPGSYCSSANRTAAEGLCAAGYFCPEGSLTAYHAKCPPGKWCAAGAGAPSNCPSGTYSAAEALTNVTSCLDCPAGNFCSEPGLTAPSGNCEAGFYCLSKQTSRFPVNNAQGGACPKGHFCLQGTPAPVPCEPGTYSDDFGQSSCSVCPAGFFCEGGAISYSDHPCPLGYWYIHSSYSTLL